MPHLLLTFKCCIQTMTLYTNVFRFELNLDFRIVIRSAALDRDLHGVAHQKLGLDIYVRTEGAHDFRFICSFSGKIHHIEIKRWTNPSHRNQALDKSITSKSSAWQAKLWVQRQQVSDKLESIFGAN